MIHSYTWAENALLSESFDPWFDYFTTPSVVKKLDNYYMLRCNLHLKFVINASPFYYGCAMASYRPLTDSTGGGAFVPCVVNGGTGLASHTLMGRSQRPRVFLYPQGSQGAQMTLPFFYHKNWLDLTSQTDLQEMGCVALQDMNMVLSNANGVAGTDANILVYAWATEVQLAGPTLQLQSKDEYGNGPISKPASAIARYARMLGDWPVIGTFATATSLIAQTAADVASLFGYTNVPVIADVHSFKNKMLPVLATTDIGTPIEKLTVDCKNELSIDNKLNGIDLGDELVISRIVSRESFLDTYTWTGTDAPGTLLFNSKVTPELCLQNTVAGRTYVQGTPMWMVSHLFSYWRGDIIFRFKIIASQYHRGRLKISWDPVGNIAATAESTNLVYTRIIDITEENDIEFVVPYTQLTSYLSCNGSLTNEFDTTPLTNDLGFTNGVLTVRVLNYQTSPVADANIYICVFARGSENLEFASPSELYDEFTPYTVQSADILYDTPTQYQLGIKPSTANDNINLIHMGETIKSLRQIMRRTSLSRRLQFNFAGSAGSAHYSFSTLFPRMPSIPGWDSNGIDLANKALTVGTGRYNFCYMTTLDWINSCFVAHKGSVHWTAELSRDPYDNNLYNASLSRVKAVRSTADFNAVLTGLGTSNNAIAASAIREQYPGHSGRCSTAHLITPVMSISVPFYNKYKFASNSYQFRNLGSTDDDSDTDSVYGVIAAYQSTTNQRNNVRINLYCSIGTDFNSIFFLNVPGYQIGARPTPV